MEDQLIRDEAALPSNRSTGHNIPGMESVVATVSGYHGSQRFKLIKLINHTGANYVGMLSRSITHLVCWKFEGHKYEMAKSFGTTIISHSWFEDCVKAGKRLPERQYLMKSGQQVRPLSWEVPLVAERENVPAKKNSRTLSDVTNTSKAIRESENIFFDLGMNESLHMAQKNLKQASRLNRKSTKGKQHEESCCYPSMQPTRLKRNIDSAIGSSVGDLTRRSRRFVKRSACAESDVSSFEQECSPLGTFSRVNRTVGAFSESNDPMDESASPRLIIDQLRSPNRTDNSANANDDNKRIENESSPQRRTSANTRNQELEDVDDITASNQIAAPIDSNIFNEEVPLDQERPSMDGFSVSEEHKDKLLNTVGKSKQGTQLPNAAEVSCVICWTEFSGTRGVLPCGHRFCYSCIQSWADEMASARKVSTCPLCKASFRIITKVDGAGSSDQKIYSQTVPSDSSVDIFVLPDWGLSSSRGQSSTVSVCCQCHSREPEDLLVSCRLCTNRWIHRYCLDPPLFPWTCMDCRDLRMLYQRYHCH